MAREAAAVSSETSCGISFDKLKKWRAEFFEDREAGDRALRKPFEEQKNQRDFIEYFLRPEGSSIPIPHLEAAKAFLFDRQMGAILPLSKYRACVSSSRDRMGNSLIVNPDLTSSELSSLLQRLNADLSGKGQTGVNRILINIFHLDPEFARSLIFNVTEERTDALRCALLGHISRCSALRITVPIKNYIRFRLEFHLPYLTMAHSETILGSSIDKKNRQVKSPAIDLSFLRAETEQVGESSYIFNAHASIVIHGTDHFKYTGYSFLFQGLVPYDVELIDETEGEMSDAEDDEELLAIEPLIDHFVTHRCAPTLLASESPADPRELFLEAVHHRCNIIAKEYTHVVVQVEKRVKAWIDDQFLSRSTVVTRHTRNIVPMCPYETLKRVQQILQDVRAQIALAVRVWKRFESNDLAYFGDLQYMDDLGVLYNLNQTRELFEDIEGLVLRLVLLEQSCENHTDILDYRVASDDNKLNRQNSLTNAQASKINRDTAELAAHSLDVAKKTTQISHISIYFALVTTPLIIVLQYFTSEQKLFAFERTPKTFFISVVILLMVLLSLALALYGIDVSKGRVFWKIYETCGGTPATKRKRAIEVTENDEGTNRLHP